MKNYSKFKFLPLVCVLTTLMMTSVLAAGVDWSGDIGPTDPTTWTSATDATIGNISGGSGSITVNDSGTLLANDLAVAGTNAVGSLTVNENGNVVLSEYLIIGRENASSGTVLVDGGTLSYGYNAYVGEDDPFDNNYGVGSVTVRNGGVINQLSESTQIWMENGSQITVDGAGSQWNAATRSSFGISKSTVEVMNGGHLTTGRAFVSKKSTVCVAGENSVWELNNLGASSSDLFHIDSDYTGTTSMVITNGGAVQVGEGISAEIIASYGTSQTHVLVDGSNSEWHIEEGLLLDTRAYSPSSTPSASLEISDGGHVEVGGTITLGERGLIGGGASNSIMVDGGSLDYGVHMKIGNDDPFDNNYGVGSVTVRNGGVINQLSESTQIWMENGSQITVDGTGSQWNAATRSSFGISKSTVEVMNGGHLTTGRAFVSKKSTVCVAGENSVWELDNLGTLYGEFVLHKYGNGTTSMSVTNGGAVLVGEGISAKLCATDGASEVRVLVDGPDSVWSMQEGLELRNTENYQSTPSVVVDVSNGGHVKVGTSISTRFGARFDPPGGTNIVNVDSSSALTVGNATGQLGKTTIGEGGRISLSGPSELNTGGDLAVVAGGVLGIDTPATVRVAGDMSIDSDSSMTMVLNETTTGLDVSGNLMNNGKIKLTAGTALSSSVAPISVAGTWTDQAQANYLAFGGTWDDATKTFTPVSAQSVTEASSSKTVGGETVNLYEAAISTGADTAARLQISAAGDASAPSVSLDFTTSTEDSTLSLTAYLSTEAQIEDLLATASVDEGLAVEFLNSEASWVFDFDVQPTGEVMLSFDLADEEVALDDLRVWHYNEQGDEWTLYAADDLFIADGTAYFTVDSFSGYGVISVPEPATAGLLAGAGLVIAAYRRIRKSYGME